MADPSVAVLIPFAGTCPHRLAALEWVRGKYPWPVIIGTTDGDWCKAVAVADALSRTSARTLVIADADVWCDSTPWAVEAVAYGRPWAVPHKLVHRLSPESTERVLAGSDWRGLPLSDDNPQDDHPYVGKDGGGIVVVNRDAYLDAPLDRRFIGWGQEDVSWGRALRCIHGPPWRADDDLVHLWHPAQPRKTRYVGSDAGELLRRRYRDARRKPEAMRSLIEEGR